MESLIKEKGNDEEVLEHSKRINNIKTEFKNIVNKFNSIQKSYINRKAQTALIEDVQVSINQKRIDNLIDDDNEEKEKEKKNNKKENTTQQILNLIKNKNIIILLSLIFILESSPFCMSPLLNYELLIFLIL